jgi:acetylglutamate kinase
MSTEPSTPDASDFIDGRLRHSLLLEIYTNQGVGTEIVAEPA